MSTALRVIFSLALIVLLFAYFVDAGEFVRILQGFDPAFLLLTFAVITIDRILMTFKWLLLLRAQGHRLSLWQGVMIYCSSMVWGFALPATVGADAIRAVMVSKRGINGTDVVASIVVERVVGFVLALALGIVCLGILRSIDILDARYDQALYLGMAALACAIVTLIVSLNQKVVAVLLKRLPQRLRDTKVLHILTKFTGAYQSLGNSRGTLVQFGALTSLEQLLSVIVPWTIARGLGVDVDLLVLLGVLPISTLLSRLPVSFDGLGVFEAIFVGLLMLAGISAESSLAIAISARVLQLIAFLPWWLAYVLRTRAISPPVSESAPSVRS
jgi:glycosyltransferase 2 family protein